MLTGFEDCALTPVDTDANEWDEFPVVIEGERYALRLYDGSIIKAMLVLHNDELMFIDRTWSKINGYQVACARRIGE